MGRGGKRPYGVSNRLAYRSDMASSLFSINGIDARKAACVTFDASATDSVTVVTLVRAAWTQSVLRAVAAATNLSLAHTRVAVIGSGGLSAMLAHQLRGMGARVVVVGDDPVALVPLAATGLDVRPSAGIPGDVTVAIATGEMTAPVSVASIEPGRPLVLADAAIEGTAVDMPLSDTHSGRPGVGVAAVAVREVFLLAVRAVADDSAASAHERLAARYTALAELHGPAADGLLAAEELGGRRSEVTA